MSRTIYLVSKADDDPGPEAWPEAAFLSEALAERFAKRISVDGYIGFVIKIQLSEKEEKQ